MNNKKIPTIIIKEAVEMIKTLPEDHNDRKWAQALIDSEYGPCKNLEAGFNELWLGQLHINKFSECYIICDYLCVKVKVPHISFIKKETEQYFGGQYFHKDKSISLQPKAPIVDLLHELSHHILDYNSNCLSWWRKFRLPNEGAHGKGFLAVENYLFKHILHLQKIHSHLYTRSENFKSECSCKECRPYSLADLVFDEMNSKRKLAPFKNK